MFDVYTSKPGGEGKDWRWVLSERALGLSRREAADLCDEIKAEDKAMRCIVYVHGRFRYWR